MIKTVYVEQYGGWWKFTPAEWRDLLLEGIANNGYVIRKKELAARPRKIDKFGGGEERESYYCSDSSVLIYSPLDWEEEAFRAALAELDELMAPKAATDVAPA